MEVVLIAAKDDACGIRELGLDPSWDYKLSDYRVNKSLHLSLIHFLFSEITIIPISQNAFVRAE